MCKLLLGVPDSSNEEEEHTNKYNIYGRVLTFISPFGTFPSCKTVKGTKKVMVRIGLFKVCDIKLQRIG